MQSFPDWFEFYGNETERFNQIGNAVPPLLAYQLACQIKESLAMPQMSMAEAAAYGDQFTIKTLFERRPR